MPKSAFSPQQQNTRCRKVWAVEFWLFVADQTLRNESERLKNIQAGLPATLFQTLRETFQLQDKQAEALLHMSVSTYHRRRREGKNLDTVASERLDRIATVSHLAMKIFEDESAAINWLSRSNEALGGQVPVILCGTDIEAKQVLRLLHAMESGGAA